MQKVKKKEKFSILTLPIRKRLGILENKKVLALYNAGLTPFRATILSVLFKLATIYLIFLNKFIFASIAIILDYAFDVLDGMLARAANKTTKEGKYIDIGTDVGLRRLNYLIIAYNGLVSYPLALITLASMLVNPSLVYLADKAKIKRNKYIVIGGDMFLLFFALLTGKFLFFFYLIIIANIVILILNLLSMAYLNLIKK